MTREQAIICINRKIAVEDRTDEDFRTGFIYCLSPYTDHAAVIYDDDNDGETETVLLRDLVVQYPEDLEPRALVRWGNPVELWDLVDATKIDEVA
jgi:hypothetical protein